jgi:DNA-binding LacI/PurR family transcriptional regulator
MANDEQAMTFLRMVMDRDISVPQDVSVIGFDGIEEGARFWPGLTTVAQPMNAIGSAAARIVLQMIEGTETQIPDYVEFDTELVVRESTGPAPEGAASDLRTVSSGAGRR